MEAACTSEMSVKMPTSTEYKGPRAEPISTMIHYESLKSVAEIMLLMTVNVKHFQLSFILRQMLHSVDLLGFSQF
jgi:hypothetical protein